MAAPHNLSFHSNHTSEQSLQTPDTSSLLLQASEPTPRILSNNQGFQSLEELLNDAGVNTNESSNPLATPSHTKRSLNDSDFPIPTKRFKVDETNVGVSAGLVPSILPHSSTASSSNHVSPQHSQAAALNNSLSGTTRSIPLVNPASLTSQSLAMPNSLASPLIASSSSGPSLVNNASSVLGSQPPLALGSISLLVQLYKQFQAQGNMQGMHKIKEQLSVLQSQLIAKSKTLTGQTGLTGTINITPSLSSSSTGNAFQPVLVPAASTSVPLLSSHQQQHLNGPSIVTNGVMHTRSSSNSPPTLSSLPNAPSVGGTLPLNSLATDLLSSGLHKPTSSLSTIQLPTHISGSGVSQSSSGLNTASLLQPSSSSSLINHPPPVSSASSVFNLLPAAATVTSVGPSTAASSPSPSFVTHMTPSSAQLPLGLQVTPQTQANVLKAVYSYRLQQIQDFLSSLPPSQKPTTTQGLRELLIKNNVLSKALPADFLTQLQKMSPQQQQVGAGTSGNEGPADIAPALQDVTPAAGTTASSLPVVPPSSAATPSLLQYSTSTVGSNSTRNAIAPVMPNATVPNAMSATSTPLSSTLSSSTSDPTTTSSTQGNISLPGVTLETLKTLCRLPEADFVRIPMPAMLMTIVHFLRTNKWTGNSGDLPGLLKQAQEALAKNSLTNVAPTPPVVQATKLSSTPAVLNSKNKTSTNNSSPLSQLMASFGMKATATTNHVITTSSLSNSSSSKSSVSSHLNHPVTRQQSKAYQEQLEREKIANLQKILQSSEEARIAFRFKAHVEKLNQQLLSPDTTRPFTNWQDLILRLLPYHVCREPELPAGAMEKADAVYEGIAGVLLSRAQGLMSRYQQLVVKEEKESSEDRAGAIVLDRLWVAAEQERKEEEERQRKEAEEIAAELSVVGGGMMSDSLDTDPFLLESDSYDDDPFLSQIWGDGLLGQPTDFSTGIT